MSATYEARPQRRHTHRQTGGRAVTSSRHARLSALEIATLLVIAVLLVVGALSVRPTAPSAEATRVVQVETGDTLWSIAKAHPRDGLTTAQTAEAIAVTNALSSSTLSAGQTLIVPVGTEREQQVASR